MADLEVNGHAVLSARVSFPRVGRWVADLEVDTDELVTGDATLVAAGAFTLQGHVQHGGLYAEYLALRVVGGTGGLDVAVQSVYSSAAPLRTLVSALLQSVGETLSSTSDQSLLGRLVPAWVRPYGLAGAALQSLVDAAGATWRVLDDGKTWIGTDTYPTVTLDDNLHDLLHSSPSETHDVYSGAPVPPIRPGTTLLGRRIGHVEYHMTPELAELDVWYERGQTTDDRLYSALAGLIRAETRVIDYHALYRCQVTGQAGDGTLSLAPRLSRLPPLTGVRLAQLVPGVAAQVSGGDVLLAFEDGDPSRPVALAAWNGGSTIAVPVKDCGILSGVSASPGSPVTFTYNAPDGTVQTGVQVLLSGRIKS